MLKARNGGFYIEGTSALKEEAWALPKGETTIIPFPAPACDKHVQRATQPTKSLASLAKQKALAILEASEMYCSLRLEDFRGCSYGIFTKGGVTMLSFAISAIAIVSVVAGA